MNEIAADLGVNTSPQTLARCAEFLMQHRQFERAIGLYIMAKRYVQAIEMCKSNNITISDDMAEKLTPKVIETTGGDVEESGDRKEILLLLAKVLKNQGGVHYTFCPASVFSTSLSTSLYLYLSLCIELQTVLQNKRVWHHYLKKHMTILTWKPTLPASG